jgi:outer membrane receptor protein involved in Fe transport
MKPITHRLVLIAAAVLSACLPSAALCQPYSPAVNAPAMQPGFIDGTLALPLNFKTLQITNVTVTVVETGATSKVDKYGGFHLPDVAPGTYTLVAAGEGFSKLRITDVVVRPDRGIILSPEIMPVVVKEGEVQVMQEVVVNAQKDNQDMEVLERYIVADSKAEPFIGTPNIDLPRTTNDVLPYYMWDSNQIEASGAKDIMDFFQNNVPMNTNRLTAFNEPTGQPFSNISIGGLAGNAGVTNGQQNVLILVNGFQMPNIAYATGVYEASLSGIPLGSIDHIEVLTGSASAIYGASAAGGVVNVVLKHDYSGAELGLTYENTFKSDAPTKTVTLNVGENLEGGKTNFMLTSSYQTVSALTLQDRMSEIIGPYQTRYYQNYPGGETAFLGLTNAAGAFTTSSAAYLPQPIITSSTGKALFTGSTATTVQVPAGYQSFQANGLAPLQANVGNFNFSHPNVAEYLSLGGANMPLTGAQTEKALELSARRQMTHWLEIYGQFGTSNVFSPQIFDVSYFSSVTVPATAPGNPFGQAVKVTGVESGSPGEAGATYDIVTQNAAGGAKISLPFNWKADVNFSWQTSLTGINAPLDISNTTALAAAVNSGAVNLITDVSKYPFNYSPYYEALDLTQNTYENDFQVKAAGPLMNLWAGAPTLAVGLQHQKSGSSYGFEYLSAPGNATTAGVATTALLSEVIYIPGASTDDDSAYAELTVPLVARKNAIFGVKQLDLQVAGRMDTISEGTTSPSTEATITSISNVVTSSPALLTGAAEPYTGNVTKFNAKNGTVGLKYKPVDDVFLRASYSTAFVPPWYGYLLAPISTGTITQTTGAYPGVPTTAPWNYSSITDPLLGATYTVPVKGGGNPGVQPEKSKEYDWGVVFEPKFLSGLRLSLDYTRTTKFDDIIAPGTAVLLANPAAFPGRVVRGTPNAGQTVGPVILLDNTYVNAPEVVSSSYNIAIDYTFKTANAGTFKISGIANSWQHYRIQSTFGGVFVEELGNPNTSATGVGAGLAKLKANLSLEWAKGPFTVGWNVRYVGPYTIGSFMGIGGADGYEGTVNGWVSGQIYHDVFVEYRLGRGARGSAWWRQALANTTLQLGVKDVFNHVPPYDALDYSSANMPVLYSAYGDPRLAEYRFKVTKTF